MVYDIIIIGSGAAGLTSAIYAARKKLNTLILAKEVGGHSLSAASIENYPGFLNISGQELARKIEEQVAKYGVEIKGGVVVSGIEKKGGDFLIKTEEGEIYESKTIIIASGRIPKRLGVPGEKEFENRGISFCSICDAPLYAGKKVAVIGGGNAALMSAIDLLPYAEKIYVLQHRQRFIGDEILQEKLKKSGKAELIVSAETLEIKGEKFVEKIIYEDLLSKKKKELAIGGVFVNIGYLPNTSFAKDFLDLNEYEEIIINPRTTETSVKGIFAAGDVAGIPYKQYIIAAAEGAKAALSAYKYLIEKS